MSTDKNRDTIQSNLLLGVPNIRHGFGDRKHPFPSSIIPKEHWELRRPQWKQVHGVAHAFISQPNALCREVDSLATQVAQCPIAVVTADCVPILLAKEDGSAIAAVHAGWRGTFSRILAETLSQIEPNPFHRSRWVAAIGPCAHPCCYEVSEELAEQFRSEFGGIATPTSTRHLDLPAVNRRVLEDHGVQRVEIINECTICSRTPQGEIRFESYRRDGQAAARQFSCIEIL